MEICTAGDVIVDQAPGIVTEDSIHVRDSRWCTISNVGCKDGVVNVYDSLYPSDTITLIA